MQAIAQQHCSRRKKIDSPILGELLQACRALHHPSNTKHIKQSVFVGVVKCRKIRNTVSVYTCLQNDERLSDVTALCITIMK
jgi:hypothetical protein